MKASKIGKNRILKEKLDDLKIDVGLQILELRLIKNKTQDALAKMIGTQQPSIARAERGATIPSLDFLNKIAVALGTELIAPKFSLVEENERRFRSEMAAVKIQTRGDAHASIMKFALPNAIHPTVSLDYASTSPGANISHSLGN